MIKNNTTNPPCLGHEKPQYISPTVAVKTVVVEDGFGISSRPDTRMIYNETMTNESWDL